MMLYSSQTFASFRGIIIVCTQPNHEVSYIYSICIANLIFVLLFECDFYTAHFATAFRVGLNRKISFLPTGEMQLMSMCGIFFSLYLNGDRLIGASSPKTVGVLCC
jgi:hypothetical protein